MGPSLHGPLQVVLEDLLTQSLAPRLATSGPWDVTFRLLYQYEENSKPI